VIGRSNPPLFEALAELVRLFAGRYDRDGFEQPPTIEEVLRLVERWTEVLGVVPIDPYEFNSLVARWRAVIDEVCTTATHDALSSLYPEVERVLEEVDRIRRAVDRARASASDTGDALRAGFRNATMTMHGDEVRIDGVKDWMDLWLAMMKHFKEARGTVDQPLDTVPPKAPRGKVPNTTVGEVLWLVEFWSHRSLEMGTLLVTQDDARKVVQAWNELVAHVKEAAKSRKNDDRYPDNWSFWHGLGKFVGTLDAVRISTVPDSWTLPFEAFGHAMKASAEAVEDLAVGAYHAGKRAVGAVYDAGKTVAGDLESGVEGFFKGVTKPIVIGGVVVASVLAIAWVATRSKGSA
jgi:hypothetical protein